MAEAHPTRPEDEEDTPRTRSYVDQLLKGNMSPSEISTLRAEIGQSQDEDEARTMLRAPISEPSPDTLDDDEDAGGGRTAVHVYSPDELAREAELRRRAALRAPVTTPPKRVPASTVPPGPPSAGGRPAPRTAPSRPVPAAPASGRGVSQAPRTLPPASVPGMSQAPRTVPPAPASLRSVAQAPRTVPPARPSSPSAPPGAPSRSAPPTARTLTQAFLKAIGGNAGLLQIAVPAARLTELNIGHDAGFVISRIDGMTSIEDILDLSPLGRVETLQILHELLRSGVLRVDGGA